MFFGYIIPPPSAPLRDPPPLTPLHILSLLEKKYDSLKTMIFPRHSSSQWHILPTSPSAPLLGPAPNSGGLPLLGCRPHQPEEQVRDPVPDELTHSLYSVLNHKQLRMRTLYPFPLTAAGILSSVNLCWSYVCCHSLCKFTVYQPCCVGKSCLKRTLEKVSSIVSHRQN